MPLQGFPFEILISVCVPYWGLLPRGFLEYNYSTISTLYYRVIPLLSLASKIMGEGKVTEKLFPKLQHGVSILRGNMRLGLSVSGLVTSLASVSLGDASLATLHG